MLKTVFVGLILGVTLGVSLAAEVFSKFGIHPNIYLLVLIGLVFASLLINRGAGMVAGITVLAIAALQPDHVLLEHGFDKDLLLAALLAIVVYPLVYRLMNS